MDSITHIVVGGCIGEAIAGKQLGKKALIYGAIAQSIPDIDFVNSFWMDTADDLLEHRGITHSFLFVIIVSIILGIIMHRLHFKLPMNRGKWMLFIGVEMLFHILLDAQNNYGTGWFTPFSDVRIAFNTLFVADPLFTIWPLIAFIYLLLTRIPSNGQRPTVNGQRLRLNKHRTTSYQNHGQRSTWYTAALLLSAVYFSCCVYNKYIINSQVKAELKRQQLSDQKYFTTPTPFNNFLWYVVAADNNGFYVGYRSVFDVDKKIRFSFFPQNESLLAGAANQHDINILKKFSQGFYTVEMRSDTLVFSDLRFGQITGWFNPRNSFSFYYYLNEPDANDVVVQRGRFTGWNKETINALFERIRGN